MSTITQLTAVPADLIGAQALPMPKPIDREPKKAKAIGRPADDADQRLVIREGVEDGLFIYTVIDRSSGKVMAQIPREDAANFSARPDYEAGQVVDTKI
jgi:pyocin large subunit-like protein